MPHCKRLETDEIFSPPPRPKVPYKDLTEGLAWKKWTSTEKVVQLYFKWSPYPLTSLSQGNVTKVHCWGMPPPKSAQCWALKRWAGAHCDALESSCSWQLRPQRPTRWGVHSGMKFNTMFYDKKILEIIIWVFCSERKSINCLISHNIGAMITPNEWHLFHSYEASQWGYECFCGQVRLQLQRNSFARQWDKQRD